MKHVMLDLETLATTPDAAVLQCAACRFNPDTGEVDTVNTFNQYLSRDANDKAGRRVDPGTIAWWAKQGPEAQARLAHGETQAGDRKFGDMLRAFHAWAGDCVIWSNGATFDVAIVEDGFRSIGMQPPWKFWNVRDVRTIVDLAERRGLTREMFPLEGTAHDALDDAIHQARYVSAMWQVLTL